MIINLFVALMSNVMFHAADKDCWFIENAHQNIEPTRFCVWNKINVIFLNNLIGRIKILSTFWLLSISPSLQLSSLLPTLQFLVGGIHWHSLIPWLIVKLFKCFVFTSQTLSQLEFVRKLRHLRNFSFLLRLCECTLI